MARPAASGDAPAPAPRRRRVLLLAHGLPVGGTEMLLCHLARHLPEAAGYDVEVGCLDEIGELGRELEREGIPVVCYGRRPGIDLRVPFRIAGHVRRAAIDLVHAHQLTSYVHGVLAKVLCGVPLVFTEHGRFHPDVSTARRRLFNRLFARLVDHTTAVSESVRSSLHAVESFPRQGIEIIPNGIDVGRFATSPERRRSARRRLDLPESAPVVGTVGRLDPIKNQTLLVEAFAILAREREDAVLVILGDGSERARLEKRIRELDLGPRVRLLGSRPDVPDLLAGFDVFTLSSFSEGIPISLLEAMAASVPIVASAVGGIPEILVDREEAWLFPSPAAGGDAETLAAAWRRLLDEPELRARLSRNALDRVRRELGLDSLLGRYAAVYDRVLSPSA